jgi:hypothetical protein
MVIRHGYTKSYVWHTLNVSFWFKDDFSWTPGKVIISIDHNIKAAWFDKPTPVLNTYKVEDIHHNISKFPYHPKIDWNATVCTQ